MNIEVTDEFQIAINEMENTQNHLFITGKAGTGKSTLLQYFRSMTEKEIVVLAPTGIAAINVKGQTIHSFFGFPPRPIQAKDIGKRRERELYENLDTIIIDEISMVRADILDSIDYFMRINGRRRDLPFGGVQMIFIGDLFQLPPVVATNIEEQLLGMQYYSPHFFSAWCLQKCDMKYIELTKVFRQEDEDFVRLLNKVRVAKVDRESMAQLNMAYDEFFYQDEEPFITLCTTNSSAQRINDMRLSKLMGEEFVFKGKLDGEMEKRALPGEINLILKIGAQIIFTKNDSEGRWVNGTIGIIEEIGTDKIEVNLWEDGRERRVEVKPVKWELLKYDYNDEKNAIETKVVGTFTQLPIKLAWAITIHKSQGKTFDKIVVDLGRGAFAPGQVYVALSRCKTFEGIILNRPIRQKDIFTDERILAFALENGIYL